MMASHHFTRTRNATFTGIFVLCILIYFYFQCARMSWVLLASLRSISIVLGAFTVKLRLHIGSKGHGAVLQEN